jgi:predicted Rossmann fold flavoprotein
MLKTYDVIIIGAGASGLIASIIAKLDNKEVLLVEQMPNIGTKLKASGGGRCNLTNKLPQSTFIEHFGKNGRFIQDALNTFSQQNLIEFFESLGIKTDAKDGFRVFPIGHNSQTIIDAFKNKLTQLDIKLQLNCAICSVSKNDDIFLVSSKTDQYFSKNLIIATGGLGYAKLGATGDGYNIAKQFGHTITQLAPAMMPLKTKESWVKNCKANTIPKTTIKIDIPKYKKLKASGDLIFTDDGLRGPVVLDFAREISMLLNTYNQVPIKINLTKGKNQEQIYQHLKSNFISHPNKNILQLLQTLIPKSVAIEFLKLLEIDPTIKYNKIKGDKKEQLVQILTSTPFTIIGHNGFKQAMITRGGISLKEIDSKTMQSKLTKGLYFCGEVIDIDGPCGGYNLQWAFSSGYLAGKLLS